MSPADYVPVPRRAAAEQMSKIDRVDRQLEALLALLAAAGENRLAASHVHELLLPTRNDLAAAAEAWHRILGH
ncbi:hypothetical protein [Azohydromonas lata]|uniref:Uncharacterized protein n=1 Tax=Azohydromonas lata TaxID=45677 RepID=A0ABU5ICZ9_9BURK|nr:hypothetical protein [Azohydromonas lata]MDZ5456971.1 hypothetical protein [Azohydromonas lata]